MHPGDHLASLGSFRRPLVGGRQLALCLGQLLLFLAEETRVRYLLAIGQGSNCSSPTSMPTASVLSGKDLASMSQTIVAYHLPVALRRTVQVLGVPSRSRCWANFYQAHLAQTKVQLFERKAGRLRVGQAIVAAFAL